MRATDAERARAARVIAATHKPDGPWVEVADLPQMPRWVTVIPTPFRRGGWVQTFERGGEKFHRVRVALRYWATPHKQRQVTVCVGWYTTENMLLVGRVAATFGVSVLPRPGPAAHGWREGTLFVHGLRTRVTLTGSLCTIHAGSVKLWVGQVSYFAAGVRALLRKAPDPAPGAFTRVKRRGEVLPRPSKRSRITRVISHVRTDGFTPDDVTPTARLLRLVLGSWAPRYRNRARVEAAMPGAMLGRNTVRNGIAQLAHVTPGGRAAFVLSDAFTDALVLHLLNGAGNFPKRKAELAEERRRYADEGVVDGHLFISAITDRLNRYMRMRHPRTGTAATRNEWETPPAPADAATVTRILTTVASELGVDP